MRDENIEVFKDTERLCRTNAALVEAIKNSSENQKVYLEKDAVICEKNRFSDTARIVISKKRSFEAAAGYNGQSIVVHNFASASNPGGGVVNGSSAQEECLCRCSTLYFNLIEKPIMEAFYFPHRAAHNPLHNDDVIYTPQVVIFKSDTSCPQLLEEAEWQKVNVITCAAPNLRNFPAGSYISDKDLQALHEKRARRILDLAAAGENEVVILGAFGCGAFANPPELVAAAYKNMLADYMHAFKTIEFAVYCAPWDQGNYEVFKEILGPGQGL